MVLCLIMLAEYFPIMEGSIVHAEAWDGKTIVSSMTNLKFYNDEVPGERFYINAAIRYMFEKNPEAGTGSIDGEWRTMDILRALYTADDFINYIPEKYFEDYKEAVKEFVTSKDGFLDKNKSTEYSRLIVALASLGQDFTDVYGYDFIDMLSQSFTYSCRQGINGPIWELIALYASGNELKEPSVSVDKSKFSASKPDYSNNEGRMLGYILARTKNKGGWSLATGNETEPDVDITAMCITALAPYYKDKNKFEAIKKKYGVYWETSKTGRTDYTYENLCYEVERGILSLKNKERATGSFSAFGSSNGNSESTAWTIVALTALGLNPKAKEIKLTRLNKTISFVTNGAEEDGVFTNNPVDALISFWAYGSGSSEAVGGFKHVCSGDDGGSGSGYTANTMATEQSTYALIAYDRLINKENSLFDMSDMTSGSVKDYVTQDYSITFDANGVMDATKAAGLGNSYAAFAEVTIPKGDCIVDKSVFAGWNTKADGSGKTYYPGDVLSMPEKDITLYAIKADTTEYKITFVTDGGEFAKDLELPTVYTPASDEIILPTADVISKAGCSFGGWYLEGDTRKNIVTSIPSGSYGDRTYVAKWNIDWTELNQFYLLINPKKVAAQTTDEEMLVYREDIEQARVIYDSLADIQKEQIVKIIKNKFINLEKKLKEVLKNATPVKIVTALINNIGDVTLSRQKAIEKARTAYDALSEAEQKEVENYSTLVLAEEKYNTLKVNQEAVDEVKNLIDGIRKIENTPEYQEKIKAAREAYTNLTQEQQALLDDDYLKILTDAEEKMVKLIESDARVSETVEAIKNIPAVSAITVTEENVEKINKAISLYYVLSDDEKAKADAQIGKETTAAKKKIDNALAKLNDLAKKDMPAEDYDKVSEFEMAIVGIGEITLESEEKLNELEKTYNGFTLLQKASLSNYYYLVMKKAELATLKTDIEVAANVTNLISQIGEVTVSDEVHERITTARKAYNRLNANQRKMVTNLSVLALAETNYANLKFNSDKADDVRVFIEAIREVDLDSYDAITLAESKYEALTDEQKAFITDEERQIIIDARKTYEALYALVIKEVKLSQSVMELSVGGSKKLVLSTEPEETSSEYTISWKSTNSAAVTVEAGENNEAIVTAKALGGSVIVASVEFMVGSQKRCMEVECSVNVTSHMTGISISKTSLTMVPGTLDQLQIGYLPEDTTDDKTVTWTSSNKKVVVVQNGLVKALKAGSATITAKVGKFKKTCKVTVKPYSITYYMGGGKNNSKNPDSYDSNTTVKLKSPSLANYTFAGWYTDSKLKHKITVIKKGSKKNYVLYAKWIKVKKPSKPVIKEAKKAKKQVIAVNLKNKVTNAKAYEIEVSANKNFKKIIKKIDTKTIKTKISKIKEKQVYVRVRAYTKDSTGKKIYSAYSLVKKIKLK